MTVHPVNMMVMMSATTGTGPLTLTPVTGWRTAAEAAGTGEENLFWYTIRHNAAAEYEIGHGYVDATTGFLVRHEVVESSSENGPVDFSEGVKEVTSSAPAQYLQGVGVDRSVTIDAASDSNIVDKFNGLLELLGVMTPVVEEPPDPFEFFTARSVVFKIYDGWGGIFIGIRRLRFYKDGVQVPYVDSWIAAATSIYSYLYVAIQPFMPLVDIGGWESRGWFSSRVVNTNQKLVVSFPEPIEFDEIRYVNIHDTGINTKFGIKNVDIIISTAADISTVWADPVPDSTQIFSGVFNQHVDSNVADEQTLTYSDLSFSIYGDFLHVGTGYDYSTITSAIAAASVNDVVVVHEGTYAENVVLDKWVHLRGVGFPLIETAFAGIKYSVTDGNYIPIDTPHIVCEGFNIIATTSTERSIELRNTQINVGKKLIVNKCACLSPVNNGSVGMFGNSGIDVEILNCDLLKGYGHVLGAADTITWNVSKTKLEQPLSLYSCVSPASSDVVVGDSDGYGVDFGSYIIPL